MNAPDFDPITKLFKAVRDSERMNGIKVTFGARSRPLEDSAPRIVMIPTAGPIQAPDHAGNQADTVIALECECWARDFSTLWEVCRRLIDAVNDYSFEGDDPADTTADGVADCIRQEPVQIEFEEEPDTNRQGWFGVVTINVTASFEFTPLAEDSGIGHVDSVSVVPE